MNPAITYPCAIIYWGKEICCLTSLVVEPSFAFFYLALAWFAFPACSAVDKLQQPPRVEVAHAYLTAVPQEVLDSLNRRSHLPTIGGRLPHHCPFRGGIYVYIASGKKHGTKRSKVCHSLGGFVLFRTRRFARENPVARACVPIPSHKFSLDMERWQYQVFEAGQPKARVSAKHHSLP